MEQIRTAHETSNDQANDVAADSLRMIKELRTLTDLEMVYVGGGDGIVIWP